ncbi:unnamed protein product [Amoebophrya sp. A25]|nr:unnamed protein product [Amoebophrya sp. A25]|eukprot:GSA25T00014350001.1
MKKMASGPLKMTSQILRFLFVLSAALLLVPTGALFLDEIGKWDWALHSIGAPRKFLYTKKAIVTVSGDNVLALLSWSSGKLAWRKVLENRYIREVVVDRSKSRAFVLSSEPTPGSDGLVHVSCFDATASGELLWEKKFPDATAGTTAIALASSESSQQLTFAYEGSQAKKFTLLGLDDGTGEPSWKTTGSGRSSAISRAGNQITVIGPGSFRQLQKKDDKPSGFKEVKVEGKSLDIALMLQNFVVLKEGPKASSGVVVNVLTGKSAGKVASLGKGLIPVPNSDCFVLAEKLECVDSAKQTVVTLFKAPAAKRLLPLEKVPDVGAAQADAEAPTTAVSILIVGEKTGAQIATFDLASGKESSAKTTVSLEMLDSMPTYVAQRDDKYLLASASHELLVSDGSASVVWRREEGLGSVADSKFWNVGVGSEALVAISGKSSVEKAAEGFDVAAAAETLLNFADTKASAILQLLENLGRLAVSIIAPPLAPAPPVVNSQTPKLKFDPSSKMLPTPVAPRSAEILRSYDGNQLIFALSVKASKVYALDAPTGKMVWTRFLSLPENKASDESTIGKVSIQTTASGTEQLLLEVSRLSGAETTSKFWVLSPLTGNVIKSQSFTLPGADVTAVPLSGQGLLLTSSDSTGAVVKSFQSSKAASSSDEELQSSIPSDVYGVDAHENTLTGYALLAGSLQKQTVWTLDFGSLGEKVLGYQKSVDTEQTVPVHVRGDATVMYRFLDPNMLVVLAEKLPSDDEAAASQSYSSYGDDSAELAITGGGGLTVYILNGVSGQILHQNRITEGAGPVHFLAAENWALVHYWNQVRSRFEIYVVDLYENREDGGAWKLLFGAEPRPRSAFQLDTPIPIHQTFIFPHRVKAIGITHTAKGITQKAVLFSLAHGESVVKLNKDQLLNPRRPLKLPDGTDDKARMQVLPKNLQVTKDDVIFPYSPLLIVAPQDILSYYLPVRASKFASAATSLESTSLVLAYGSLDLFFAPVRPSLAYDILGESFDYFILYSTGAATFLAWAITQKMVRSRQLSDRWK